MDRGRHPTGTDLQLLVVLLRRVHLNLEGVDLQQLSSLLQVVITLDRLQHDVSSGVVSTSEAGCRSAEVVPSSEERC